MGPAKGPAKGRRRVPTREGAKGREGSDEGFAKGTNREGSRRVSTYTYVAKGLAKGREGYLLTTVVSIPPSS